MNSFISEMIGYAAAFFGTILMLPQVYKTYRTRQVKDISLIMLVIYIVNCTLWGIYGFHLRSVPMLLCNGIALCIGLLMITMKIAYSRNQDNEKQNTL
jgi:MtN3 and saliva related transmembrane protein